MKRPPNHSYRDWVRSLPCAVPGCLEWQTEPHHLKGDGQASGAGLKARDELLMPLCPEHHRHIQAYRPGWQTMQREALALTVIESVKAGWITLSPTNGK